MWTISTRIEETSSEEREERWSNFMGSFASAQVLALRLWRTGRVRYPRPLREAWVQHCANETYLTQPEAEALATRLLPGARVFHHWLWSYTIVWDQPRAV